MPGPHVNFISYYETLKQNHLQVLINNLSFCMEFVLVSLSLAHLATSPRLGNEKIILYIKDIINDRKLHNIIFDVDKATCKVSCKTRT